jgi:hypothetical protein
MEREKPLGRHGRGSVEKEFLSRKENRNFIEIILLCLPEVWEDPGWVGRATLPLIWMHLGISIVIRTTDL